MTEQKKETHQVELTGVYVFDHDGSAIHTLVPCDNELVEKYCYGKFDTYVLKRICNFDNLGASTFEAFTKEKIVEHDLPVYEHLFIEQETEIKARGPGLPEYENKYDWDYSETKSKKEIINRYRETKKYPKILKIKLTIETEEISPEEQEVIWNKFQQQEFDQEMEYRKKEMLENTEEEQ